MLQVASLLPWTLEKSHFLNDTSEIDLPQQENQNHLNEKPLIEVQCFKC